MGMRKYFAAIGFLILAAILSQINLETVTSVLLGLNPVYYFPAVLFTLVLIALRGLKWKLILSSQGVKIPLFDASKYFCIGFLFSSVTPAKIGDFVRALYLKNERPALSISSVVLDRLVDIATLIALAGLASYYLAQEYQFAVFPPELIAVLVVLFAAGIFLLFREKYLKIIARPFFNAIVPESAKKKISVSFSDFFSSLKLIFSNKSEFGLSVLVSFLFWIASVFFSYLLALSLGIEISPALLMLIYPVAALSEALPISISGIGTRDAVFVFFFSALALPIESAIAFSLLLFFTGYVLIAALGYVFFVSEPIELKMIIKPN